MIARDRGLMDSGYKVLNYTDKEVLERAHDLAENISGILSDLAEEMLTLKGGFRGPTLGNVTPIGKR